MVDKDATSDAEIVMNFSEMLEMSESELAELSISNEQRRKDFNSEVRKSYEELTGDRKLELSLDDAAEYDDMFGDK